MAIDQRRLDEELAGLDALDVEPERLRDRLAGAFELDGTERVEYDVHLSAEDVELVVAMGPNARHGDPVAVGARPRRDAVSVQILYFRRLDTPAPNPSE